MTYQPLRPRQEDAIRALRQSVGEGHRRLIVQAATGWGKTRMAAALVEEELVQGGSVIFSVPALSLIEQSLDMFWDQDIRDVGVIQANHEKTDGLRPVQVASVQTMMRRGVPPPNMLILDEVHRFFKYYEKLLADPDWRDTIFVGLSATPWTKGLGRHFSKLIVAGTIKEGIEEGWLSSFRAFAPAIPDLATVRTVAGDYHEGDLARVMDLPPLTADLLDTWRQFAQGRPTFIFAVNRAHARHIQEEFERAGIRTAYIDAFTPIEERLQVRKGFEADDIEVVVNVGCLVVGVDWDVRCIVLARPTKSEMLYCQMIGRGLRTTPKGKLPKDHLLILDHTGTSLRLGLVSDIRHDELDTGEKKKVANGEKYAPKPKVCPKCSFLKPAGVHACPACGFAPVRKTDLRPQAGELTEIAVGVRGPNSPMDLKRRWWSMLHHRCLSKGYKSGWTYHKFVEAFHVKPPWEFRGLQPVPPDEAVLSWLLSQQIRYAKRRRA